MSGHAGPTDEIKHFTAVFQSELNPSRYDGFLVIDGESFAVSLELASASPDKGASAPIQDADPAAPRRNCWFACDPKLHTLILPHDRVLQARLAQARSVDGFLSDLVLVAKQALYNARLGESLPNPSETSLLGRKRLRASAVADELTELHNLFTRRRQQPLVRNDAAYSSQPSYPPSQHLRILHEAVGLLPRVQVPALGASALASKRSKAGRLFHIDATNGTNFTIRHVDGDGRSHLVNIDLPPLSEQLLRKLPILLSSPNSAASLCSPVAAESYDTSSTANDEIPRHPLADLLAKACVALPANESSTSANSLGNADSQQGPTCSNDLHGLLKSLESWILKISACLALPMNSSSRVLRESMQVFNERLLAASTREDSSLAAVLTLREYGTKFTMAELWGLGSDSSLVRERQRGIFVTHSVLGLARLYLGEEPLKCDSHDDIDACGVAFYMAVLVQVLQAVQTHLRRYLYLWNELAVVDAFFNVVDPKLEHTINDDSEQEENPLYDLVISRMLPIRQVRLAVSQLPGAPGVSSKTMKEVGILPTYEVRLIFDPSSYAKLETYQHTLLPKFVLIGPNAQQLQLPFQQLLLSTWKSSESLLVNLTRLFDAFVLDLQGEA